MGISVFGYGNKEMYPVNVWKNALKETCWFIINNRRR